MQAAVRFCVCACHLWPFTTFNVISIMFYHCSGQRPLSTITFGGCWLTVRVMVLGRAYPNSVAAKCQKGSITGCNPSPSLNNPQPIFS